MNLLRVIVLLSLSVLVTSIYYCSTYCAAAGCSGISGNSCTSCALNWVISGSTCASTNGLTFIDRTTDFGIGTLVFNPSTSISSGSYTYIGNIESGSTVTVTSAGMTQPHYSLELDCWVVALAGAIWTSTNHFQVALGAATQNRTIGEYNTSANLFGAASNQYFYRIASTFAHSATSTQIKFIISANQGGQQYGVAQCILLASLCHASCLTCSAETSTACLTCESGKFISSGTCTACSIGCATCTSSASTSCLSCLATYGFLTNACYKPCLANYYLNGGNCSACYTGCATCTSSTANTCLSCSATYGYFSNTCQKPCPTRYYLNGGNCSICYSGCASCTSSASNTCLSCIAPYGFKTNICYNPCPSLYFLNGGNCTACWEEPCQLCAPTLPNCIMCSSTTICIQCADLSYALSATSKCQYCSATITNCISCSDRFHCLACWNGFIAKDGNCQCPYNIVSNLCIDSPSCVRAKIKNGVIKCIYCDATNGFVLLNSTCVCKPEYRLNGSNCEPICGDGLTVTPLEACDDGNLIDNDGCSSQCEIETGFECEEFSRKSLCTYMEIPKFELQNIHRSLIENEGTLIFKLSPPFTFPFQTNQTILECNGNYTVKSIDYKSGLLTIVVSFSTNLENLPANLTLEFNPTLVASKNVSLEFEIISDDLPLIICSRYSEAKIFSYLFLVLSLLALLLFFIGSYFHKMIGVESLFVVQLMYFLQNIIIQPSFLFNLLSDLQFSTGYSSFMFPTNYLTGDKGESKRIKLHSEFLGNCLILTILLLAVSIVYKVMQIIIYNVRICEKNEGEHISLSKISESSLSYKIEQINKKFYIVIVFPLAIGFMPSLLFAVYIQTKYRSIETFLFIQPLNAISSFAALLIVACTVGSELVSALSVHQPNKDPKINKTNQSYFLIYVLYELLIIAELILSETSLPLAMYSLCVTLAFYTVFIIIYRPYVTILHNIAIIVNAILVTIFSGVMIYRNYFPFTEKQEIYCLFGFTAIIVIVISFEIARIVTIIFRSLSETNKNENANEETKEENKKEFVKHELENLVLKKLNPYRLETINQLIRIERLNDLNEVRHIQGNCKLPIKFTASQIAAMEKSTGRLSHYPSKVSERRNILRKINKINEPEYQIPQKTVNCNILI